MSKRFNVAGICWPEKHYMVDVTPMVENMKKMVQDGEYFTVSHNRRTGKTTIIHLLKKEMQKQYIVFSLSFEGIGENAFLGERDFCRMFCRLLEREIRFGKTKGVSEKLEEMIRKLIENPEADFILLSDLFYELCNSAAKPVVLIVDEVDQSSNFETFLDFLGVIRNGFLQRMEIPTFQSVILVGVYDIKNLTSHSKTNEEATEEHPIAYRERSPFNIVSEVEIQLRFTTKDIADMLTEYEREHHTGMNISKISESIYASTQGNPYKISKICKVMDEVLPQRADFPDNKAVWSARGVIEAREEIEMSHKKRIL